MTSLKLTAHSLKTAKIPAARPNMPFLVKKNYQLLDILILIVNLSLIRI